MDKRTLRSRKVKPRNARPYDRQNQSIFGKVCSTVKGLLNPSWLFTTWTGNSEEELPEGSSDDLEENVREDNDVVSQSVSHQNKRLRLRLDDHVPSIQNSETQTWNEQPPQNLYNTISHVQSTASQSSLLENKEPVAVLNGDDHSENSEGSASTSGCSSLVSSHKESNRLLGSPFASLLEMKNSRKRKDPSPKSGFNDLNNSRSLWSTSFSPSSKFQRRLPTISHTNQPNFNVSSFVGPSKLNESMEKKTLSPFYEGKTTYGGASAVRRMPSSVAPYQVDRNLRNQIRVREQNTEDNLEGMSSAAKRILLTLEKMSTPIADAKKIPNSDTSPVDLSLYLTPPKSRRNSQFTPSIAGKGPPIANINTIAKLATLKNYGPSRLRNTLQNSTVTSAEQVTSTPNIDYLQPSPTENFAQKSGGGKMRNKLHQQHHSSKPAHEVVDTPVLKSVPLPISTLPTINLKPKVEKPAGALSAKGFTFSNPIEHDLSISNAAPTSTLLALPSPYDSSFKFSNPIEIELPNNNVLPKEKTPLPTWECSACWVRNPHIRPSCAACETPRFPKEHKSSTLPSTTSALNSTQTTSTTFKFGSQTLETPASTLGTSFTFAKSDATNQSPLSASGKPVTSFGSTTSDFVFGSKNETAKTVSSSMSQAPGFTFGSVSSFPSAKTADNDNTTSQNHTGASSVSSIFGNTSVSRTPSTPVITVSGNTGNSTKTWECSACWVRNLSKESKCMACETPRSTKDKNTGTPSAAATTTAASTNNNTKTWECSACWVRNPMKESNCMACQTPKSTKDKNPETTSATATTATTSISTSSGNWECSACWVRNSPKESKCISCEAPRTTKDKKNTEVKSLENNTNPFSTWECTSCWVRNPMKEKKCMACETLHPSADKNSVVKNSSGFKFGSPLQSSPITFKFGNYVCTAPSTVTTSSFKFGISASDSQTTTTTSSSGFKFGTPSSVGSVFGSAVTTAASKSTEASSTLTQSSSFSGFKIPSSSPSTSEKKQTENISDSFTSEPSQTNNKFSYTAKASEVLSEPPKVSESTVKTVAEDAVTKKAKSASQPPKNSPETSNPSQIDQSTKDSLSDTVITSSSPKVSVSTEKEAPCPSVTACFGFTTQPVLSVAKDTNESKLSSVFTSKSELQASAFTPPGGNLFKFGAKTDSTKNILSTTTVALTTSTTPSFSFSSNVSNFGSNPNPKTTELSSAATEARAVTVKTEDGKIPASVSFPSVTTSSPFVFGSAVTTTSAPSAFSFFPSSSASAPTSSVFTFGASSTTQASKPGGFTFKGLEKPQTTPAAPSTTSQPSTQGLNVGTPAPVPSAGFVFGTPKTEAQSIAPSTFAFGSGVTTTSSSNTSAFSAFQPSQSANASIQFGTQSSGSIAPALGTSSGFAFGKSEIPSQIPSSVSQNPVSAFGSTAPSFVFGSKNENSVQIPGAVSQATSLAFGSSASFTFNNKTENPSAVSQNPTPTFGSSAMQPVFGSNSVPPSFDGSEKPAAGGFTFGGSSSSVFQFGAPSNTEKKRAASGFAFGTPAASETNNSYTAGFSINTPSSFNFGAATSTSAGPFQFAAGAPGGPKPAPSQSAPRRYRKALRRVTKKE